MMSTNYYCEKCKLLFPIPKDGSNCPKCGSDVCKQKAILDAVFEPLNAMTPTPQQMPRELIGDNTSYTRTDIANEYKAALEKCIKALRKNTVASFAIANCDSSREQICRDADALHVQAITQAERVLKL